MAQGPTYIDVLAIPDRVDRDPERVPEAMLRLCLQLTPTPDVRPGGPIDQANWPLKIHERAAVIGVWIASIQNGKLGAPQWVGKFTPDIAEIFAAQSVDNKRIVDAANKKWGEIVGTAPLTDAIAKAGASADEVALKMNPFDAVGAAPTASIENFLDGTYRDALATSVERRLQAAEMLAGQNKGDSEAHRPQPDVQPWAAIAERFDYARAKTAVAAEKAARAAQEKSLSSQISDAIWGQPSALDRACDDRCDFLATMPAGLDELLATDKAAAQSLAFDRAIVDTIEAVGADENPDPMGKPPPEDVPSAEEQALRKLSALLSYPTLAKYFGLCADILIPPAMLEAMGGGAIAVQLRQSGESFPSELSAGDIDSLAWTAFACRKRGKKLYFGPWEGPSPPAAQACVDGLLNLAHKVGGQPRFHLGSEAALHTFFRLAEKALSIAGRIATGRLRLDDPKPLPDRTTKGIVLCDHFAKEAHAAQLQALAQASTPQINYADDLRQGLRFDVLLTPMSKKKVAEWRPLMSRVVIYSSADVDDNFLTHAKVKALAYRDDAVAVSPVNEDKPDKPVVHVELMQWAGGSLAVSSSEADPISSKDDFAVGVDFHLPDIDKARRLCPPPLRYGREYRVRARLALPLGCGMTFDDIEHAGGFADQILPPFQADGKPLPGYAYKRFEAVGAPPVVLSWDSDLVTGSDPSPPPSPRAEGDSLEHPLLPQGGRALEELVVRSSDIGKTDIRFILPARIALDEAEQQGQFDDGTDDNRRVPQGAFEDDLKVALYGPEGRLPDARLGAVTWYDPEDDTFYADVPSTIASDKIKAAQTRGSVLVVNPRAWQRQRRRYDTANRVPQPRYYPDRLARRAIVRFLTVDGFSPVVGKKAIEFWHSRREPRDALPARIELKAARAHTDAARFTGSSRVEISPPQSNDSVDVPNVTVTLQPAEMVDLEIFADCNEPGFATSHHAGCIVQDIAKRKGNAAWMLETLGADPLPQVTFSRKLRLVHAVERPITAPAIVNIKAISLTVRPEEATGSARKSWADHVAGGVENLRSEEGGAATFFVGEMSAEPRSSIQLRLDARWLGYGPETIKRNPINGQWIEDLPDEFAQLFKVELKLGEAQVNLLREPSSDDQGKLRALSYAFKDGRARRLRLRLVATSRFTAYFPPETVQPDLARIGRYERAANDFNNAPDIWLDCTFRPPPPSVDRVLPVFLWNYKRKSRSMYQFSRKSMMRVFLDPNWYASGEGEKLGVVFDNVERPVCDYEKEGLEPFSRFVTRWGRDPVRKSPSVTSLRPQNVIRPKNFNGQVVVQGKLYPGAHGGSSSDVSDSLDVLVAPIDPILDAELGLYCDIELGIANAKRDQFLPSYMPFVQLGLVRYQEHAVSGLELSRPIEYTAQLLPYRYGEVRVVSSRRLRVTVGGQNYKYDDPNLGPRLKVRILVREDLDVIGPAPSWRFAWFPATKDGEEVASPELPPNKEASGSAYWEIEIDLPTNRSDEHYGVLIEEYEWLLADPEDPKFEAPIDDLVNGMVRRRRGPVFATTIDLGT